VRKFRKKRAHSKGERPKGGEKILEKKSTTKNDQRHSDGRGRRKLHGNGEILKGKQKGKVLKTPKRMREVNEKKTVHQAGRSQGSQKKILPIKKKKKRKGVKGKRFREKRGMSKSR